MQYAVDELTTLGCRVIIGQFDILVHGHCHWNSRVGHQFGDSRNHDDDIHEWYALDFPVLVVYEAFDKFAILVAVSYGCIE